MNKYSIFLFLIVISVSSLLGQEVSTKKDSISNPFSALNDGPYIFIESNKLIQKKIINGEILSKELKADTYDTIFVPDKHVFKDVKKIAVISDVHGQYDLVIELLKNNRIIDENLDWNFDQGHLVILGDVFDRGDKVNELLWLIYKLEQHARKVGGRVHYLLGNHEYMVLHNDLRYIHKKYRLTSRLLYLEYPKLYDNTTVLGRWLRSKHTIIKINNSIFVHAGVSKEILSDTDFQLDTINEIMRSSIDISKEELKATGFYKTYYGSNSLIWYRGYFEDNLTDKDISDILEELDSEHIVVGHSSYKEIVQLFDQKIVGVDSSIKLGTYGEMLFIKNNKYSRRTLTGQRKKFSRTPSIKNE